MRDSVEREIVIPYTRREAFLAFHATKHRWACLVAHRRAGKTVALVNRLIKKNLQVNRRHPPPQTAYIGPFLNQAKRVAWAYLQHFAAPVTGVVNVADHSIGLINGGRIMLLGADNADSIRGIYLDDAVLDEFGDMRPSVWSSIIRPTLSDYRGSACFSGTPRGLNDFWATHQRSKRHPDEWYSAVLRASETGILDAEELRDARSTMTEDEYQREYECSFEASHAGSYYGKEIRTAREQGRIGTFPIINEIPIHFAADIGFTDSCAWWAWQVVGTRIRVVAYYENSGQAAQHYVEWLHAWRQQGHTMGEVWLPHDARASSFQTGRTTVEQFISGGINPRLTPNVDVQHGIDAARMMFASMDFNESSTHDGMAALIAYQREYNDERKVYSNKPRHDWSSHGSDAFRYMALVCQPGEIVAPPPPIVYARPSDSFSLDELWDTAPNAGRRI